MVACRGKSPGSEPDSRGGSSRRLHRAALRLADTHASSGSVGVIRNRWPTLLTWGGRARGRRHGSWSGGAGWRWDAVVHHDRRL